MELLYSQEIPSLSAWPAWNPGRPHRVSAGKLSLWPLFSLLPRPDCRVHSATSRLLLHENIHDKVLNKVLERAATVSVGDPLRGDSDKSVPGTCMGPLVSGPQRDKVVGFITRVSRALKIVHLRCVTFKF